MFRETRPIVFVKRQWKKRFVVLFLGSRFRSNQTKTIHGCCNIFWLFRLVNLVSQTVPNLMMHSIMYHISDSLLEQFCNLPDYHFISRFISSLYCIISGVVVYGDLFPTLISLCRHQIASFLWQNRARIAWISTWYQYFQTIIIVLPF